MRICDYIGEATDYDKKARLEVKRPKSWLKSVSAFANGGGGTLIFGVDDNDTLLGLEDACAAAEAISEAVVARMDPVPQVALSLHEEGGRQFVLLAVSAGSETPYYYVGDGSRIAYVRTGNESVPATAHELRRLVLQGAGRTYDTLASPYKVENCSFSRLRSAYRAATGTELVDEDFYSFGLANEDGALTNAGALLADEPLVRQSRVFCTRWNGLTKASGVIDALDDKELEGGLVGLLLDADRFVRNNTRLMWRKADDHRVDMPDVPRRASFEALVNALIHRDYLVLGSEVHVDIYDDRVEVSSPGGMPNGRRVQDVDVDHAFSERRNPVLADLFQRMGYMERRGSGLRKMRDSYRAAANNACGLEPTYYSDESVFWVTLPNLNYGAAIEAQVQVAQEVGLSTQKPDFENPKENAEAQKPDFRVQKPDFESDVAMRLELPHTTAQRAGMEFIIDAVAASGANRRTEGNVLYLFGRFSTTAAFGRRDVMEDLGLAASSASELINKMQDMGLIVRDRAAGRGKYRFSFDAAKEQGDGV